MRIFFKKVLYFVGFCIQNDFVYLKITWEQLKMTQNDLKWLVMTQLDMEFSNVPIVTYHTIWKVWPLKNKCTVPIKRTVTKIFQMSLLNVPYNLKNLVLNTLAYRTYNRKLRVGVSRSSYHMISRCLHYWETQPINSPIHQSERLSLFVSNPNWD